MEEFEFEKSLELHAELSEDDLIELFEPGILKLLHEQPHKLFSYLYRIDVNEGKVKQAMLSQEPSRILSELVVKKLREKLYWRNKYKANRDNEIDSGDRS